MPDLSTSPVSPNMQNPNVSVYLKPWRECRCCNKYYLNEFAVDIASNFDSFVRGKYPDDTQLQVEACYLKLRALYLYFMFERLTLTAEQKRKREVGVTANEILSLIYQMKGGLSLQPMRYIAINEGTEESARRAVAYFEKCLAVNKKIGNGQGVATTKSNIADAISMYEGGNDNEEFKKIK
jgi:hypothetical protein